MNDSATAVSYSTYIHTYIHTHARTHTHIHTYIIIIIIINYYYHTYMAFKRTSVKCTLQFAICMYACYCMYTHKLLHEVTFLSVLLCLL